VPRYSDERKEAVLRKMLPPHNRPLAERMTMQINSYGLLGLRDDYHDLRPETMGLPLDNVNMGGHPKRPVASAEQAMERYHRASRSSAGVLGLLSICLRPQS
jgi:hypothetical protein